MLTGIWNAEAVADCLPSERVLCQWQCEDLLHPIKTASWTLEVACVIPVMLWLDITLSTYSSRRVPTNCYGCTWKQLFDAYSCQLPLENSLSLKSRFGRLDNIVWGCCSLVGGWLHCSAPFRLFEWQPLHEATSWQKYAPAWTWIDRVEAGCQEDYNDESCPYRWAYPPYRVSSSSGKCILLVEMLHLSLSIKQVISKITRSRSNYWKRRCLNGSY